MPDSPVEVRPASPEDASAIARVHVDSWRTTYRGILPEEALLAKLDYTDREKLWTRVAGDPMQSLFVAVAGGQVIGFANGGRNRGNETEYSGELYSMYLLEACQRRGLGRRLTAAIARDLAESGMTSIIVWVLKANPACGFYEAIGGKAAGSKPITIGGVTLDEVAYGWPDTGVLIESAP